MKTARAMLSEALDNTPKGQLPSNLFEIFCAAMEEEDRYLKQRAQDRARFKQLTSDYYGARKTLLSAMQRKSPLAKIAYLPVLLRKGDALLASRLLSKSSALRLQAEMKSLKFEVEYSAR